MSLLLTVLPFSNGGIDLASRGVRAGRDAVTISCLVTHVNINTINACLNQDSIERFTVLYTNAHFVH